MAFYIVLIRKNENQKQVTYFFGPNEEKLGTLKLNKITGEVIEISPAPTANSSALFPRTGDKARIIH